jgi:hypothetical protein
MDRNLCEGDGRRDRRLKPAARSMRYRHRRDDDVIQGRAMIVLSIGATLIAVAILAVFSLLINLDAMRRRPRA